MARGTRALHRPPSAVARRTCRHARQPEHIMPSDQHLDAPAASSLLWRAELSAPETHPAGCAAEQHGGARQNRPCSEGSELVASCGCWRREPCVRVSREPRRPAAELRSFPDPASRDEMSRSAGPRRSRGSASGPVTRQAHSASNGPAGVTQCRAGQCQPRRIIHRRPPQWTRGQHQHQPPIIAS